MKFAVIALVLGLLGVMFGPYSSIPAVILGHFAVSKLKDKPAIGHRMAIVAVMLGYFWTVVPRPMFFGAKKAMLSAKKAKASNTAHNLRNSLAAYQSEYQIPYGAERKVQMTDAVFMSGIQGAEDDRSEEINPRGIGFFAVGTGESKPLNDPWGNPYRVVTTPISIRVWSRGADGIDGTKDDIKTW